MTAFLVGRKNDCIQALQRAYQAHLDRGETLAAVRCGFWLALVLLTSGEPAVAVAGWRGANGCSTTSTRTSSSAATCSSRMFRHIFGGEFEPAYRLAEEVTEYGRRFGDADLLANGLNAQGRMLLYPVGCPRGWRCSTRPWSGSRRARCRRSSPGEIYCSLIEACQEISDFDRVAEWTSALTTWCDAQPGLVPFTGQCAVHRGQIMRVRGAFAAGHRGVRGARPSATSPPDTPRPPGWPWPRAVRCCASSVTYDAAEAAYERAVGFGYEPQPGRALLWLARGRTDAAVRRRPPAAGRAARPGPPLAAAARLRSRSCSPPATSTRRPRSRDELAAIADAFDCAALRADGRLRAGQRAPGRGRGRTRPCPRSAGRCSGWRGARRAVRGGAGAGPGGPRPARAGRRGVGARASWRRRRRTFARRSGPPRPRGRPTALLGPAHPAGLTAREVEVLRLVARGQHQPGDRRDAGPQREDGRASPVQHLHQARRRLAHRRGRVAFENGLDTASRRVRRSAVR